MSGGACAVIISGRQAVVSAESIEGFTQKGLLSQEQKEKATKAAEEYTKTLSEIAEQIVE